MTRIKTATGRQRPRREVKAEKQRNEIVEAFVTAFERGDLDWHKAWTTELTCDMLRPTNALTGRPYSGRNIIHLAAMAMKNGLTDNRWLTMNQLVKHNKEVGKRDWRIPKGMHSPALITFYKSAGAFEREVLDESGRPMLDADGDVITQTVETRMVRQHFYVFNASQVIGIDPPEHHIEDRLAAGRAADDILALEASSRCPVTHMRVDKAFYSHSEDAIVLPRHDQFSSPESELRTLLHEMCHATADAVGREVGYKRWGDKSYAFEELVAELGCVFAAAELGYPPSGLEPDRDHFANHAAYLKDWAENLKREPDALMKAASWASTAADYVVDRVRAPVVAPSLETPPTPKRDDAPSTAHSALAAAAAAAAARNATNAAPPRGIDLGR